MSCVSAEHASPVPATFGWIVGDGDIRYLCDDCCGWWLLGALYDEGTMPRGVFLAPAVRDEASPAGWFDEEGEAA